MASYLDIKDIKKAYGEGGGYNQVLKGITTQVEKGEMCVILGPSGCGKSTFLNAVGGLDSIDSGSILVDGKEIVGLKPSELARYRKENLGFVFQFYNLVGDLTVKENIQICEHLASDPLDMDELLEILGLTAMAKRFPAQLSGGQQQRVAIARALIKTPSSCCATSPPAHSTPRPPKTSSSCWSASTSSTAPPCSWSPTTRPSRTWRTA